MCNLVADVGQSPAQPIAGDPLGRFLVNLPTAFREALDHGVGDALDLKAAPIPIRFVAERRQALAQLVFVDCVCEPLGF